MSKKALIATKEGIAKDVARETPYWGHTGETYRDVIDLDGISDPRQPQMPPGVELSLLP